MWSIAGLLSFALLVFAAGGAAGVMLVAPRLYRHRLEQLPRPGAREEGPDILRANVSCHGDVAQLRQLALQRAAASWGPDAQLGIEGVTALATLPSGKLSGTVTVRCLNWVAVSHER